MINLDMTKSVVEAIHTRLANDIGVQGILGDPPRLYDSGPEDPVFPYLTYGALRSEDKSADGSQQTEHRMSLHVWSRYQGRVETFDILKVLSQALEDAPLGLPNGQTVIAVIPYADVVRAPDGRTIHGLLRLNLYPKTSEANL